MNKRDEEIQKREDAVKRRLVAKLEMLSQRRRPDHWVAIDEMLTIRRFNEYNKKHGTSLYYKELKQAAKNRSKYEEK